MNICHLNATYASNATSNKGKYFLKTSSNTFIAIRKMYVMSLYEGNAEFQYFVHVSHLIAAKSKKLSTSLIYISLIGLVECM